MSKPASVACAHPLLRPKANVYMLAHMISRDLARSSAHRACIARHLRLGPLVALTLALAQRSNAQSNQVGRVEGVVFDSVHARALAGTHVVAVGTGSRTELRREATSDSTGRYSIDSLPLGRYLVGFDSPLLDSLEVTLTPREATVAPGQVVMLDLVSPSAAKLRAAVCLGETLPSETGVIYGHVVSAETEGPLAGVEVAMTWRVLSVDRSQKRLRAIKGERSASVVTDENGWYRMCGVPTGTWVSMQIQRDNRNGPVLRARIDDTLGIAIRHLSISTESSDSREASADAPGSAPLSGTATLSGIVRGPGGAPVASVQVRVRGTRADARTDALGAFTLRGLPAGTQELEVRRVGYALEVVPVELRSGSTATVNVAMRRIVNLDSVLVVASRPKYPDFYVHKSAGWGRFLGPEEIARQRVSRTSDIIEKLPGFVVEQRGYRAVAVALGGSVGLCPATIVIDGMRVLDYPPSVNDVHPLDIGAIESYSPSIAYMAPPEYHIGGCGGIVIWTRR
jgi:hypothetical protein